MNKQGLLYIYMCVFIYIYMYVYIYDGVRGLPKAELVSMRMSTCFVPTSTKGPEIAGVGTPYLEVQG